MLFLDYKSCTGIEKPDRNLHISAGDINPATGKAYAINPATNNWDDTYFGNVAEPAYKAANPSLNDFTGQATDLRNAAIAPALASLNASKPEVGSAFDTRGSQLGAEKQPLMDRYSALLDQIKGNQANDTTRQANTLSNEYGARGIPLSSGMYAQNLDKNLGSVNQYYSNQYTTTGLAENADLRDLTNQITNLSQQRVTALRDIDNKIAELQAGAGNSAATDALANYRAALDQKFQSRFDALDTQLKQAQIDATKAGAPLDSNTFNTLDQIRKNAGGFA